MARIASRARRCHRSGSRAAPQRAALDAAARAAGVFCSSRFREGVVASGLHAAVDQLSSWLADAAPVSRWYLERHHAGPPVFARLVPLGEMVGGLALVLGFWTRLAAGMALLMVLEFSAGRRRDIPVRLSHGRERASAGWGLAGAGDGGETLPTGKCEERTVRLVPTGLFLFQCTCLSQSFFGRLSRPRTSSSPDPSSSAGSGSALRRRD